MSEQAKWIRVTDCRNIPLREGRAVRVGGREVAIFNLGERFLAIDNRCPHKGGPLADGIVCGAKVVCPLHAWSVNLESGSVDQPGNSRACVETFRTRIEDGVVLLELPADANATTRREVPLRCEAPAASAMIPL